MTLTALKIATAWKCSVRQFSLPYRIFQKLTGTMMRTTLEHFHDDEISSDAVHTRMEDLAKQSRWLRYHSYTRYAIDVGFLQITNEWTSMMM